MKKLLSILFAIILLMACIPLGAVNVSAATSGTTGSCTWVLDGTALTISGNGSMADYEYECGPWGEDITSLTIKSGVTYVGRFAFMGCSLKSVSIPYGVTYISEWAFDGCPITSLTLPSTVQGIGDCAFNGCDITTLTIPDSVTSIGSAAFGGCDYLKTISIGSGLTYMPSDAFISCRALESITVSSQNTKFSSSNGVLFDKDQTTLIQIPAMKTGAYTIPSTVTSINGYAFAYGCSLTSITIPAGLIDLSGMSYDSSLEAINVNSQNSSYSSIDGVLFNKDQTTLIAYPAKKAGTSYTIPDTVTAIESDAFRSCSALTTVTIPNSVTSIGRYAFYYCTSLTSVTIPDSVTSIGDWAFSRCSSLTSVTIPDSVTSIGSDAFYYCTSLTSVTIPDSVTSIGSDAFYWCTSLTSVTIGDSVTSIGRYAFSGCSALTDVYYGGTEADRANMTVDSGNDKLLNATWHYAPPAGLLYEIVDGEVTITGYTDELPADLTIPATIEGYPVTTIGDFAFLECPFSSVILPDSITTIGDDAFSYSGIYSIVIPVGVTYIDDSAFHALECKFEVAADNPNYSALDGILFNKDQTTIVACGMLYAAEYAIPDSVTTIGAFAFFGADIDSLVIPAGVTTIEEYAFATARITDVYYGGTEADRANMTIDSWGKDYLLNATWHYAPPAGLLYEIVDGEVTITGYTDELPADLTIPATIDVYPVTAIKNDAFYRCTRLKKLIIGKNVTTIGNEAFSECSNLTSLTISDSVTTIGYEAFYGCKALTSIVIPDSVTTLGTGAFRNCPSVTSISIGSGITTISKFAFRDNISLTSVVIPDNVTSIGEWAFNYCKNLTSITIPADLTEVVEGAFYQCYALSDVYYGGTVEDRDNIAIGSDNDPLLNATWHCHEHTYDDNCDVDCNGCGDLRVAPHTYDDACDAACNGCGAGRTPADHVYDHEFDVDCNECGAVREMAETPVDFGGNSVSEDVSGLAFKFSMDILGMTVDRTTAIYDNATIHGYKLVAMGAIVSNSKSTVDVPCVYLCDWAEDAIAYAVRVIEIPTDKYDIPITSTPYFVIEVDGVQRTVYGETRTASYNNFS